MSGDFFNEKTVVVRKPHRCEWCDERIEAGQTALCCRGMFEGYFYRYYLHPE